MIARAAIILLIFLTLLSNFYFFYQTTALNPPPVEGDRITLYEKRFEGLKKMLPPHGVVGYLSNKQAEDIRFDAAAAEYYLTQYALSPVIVVYSPERHLVVGNFRQTGIDSEIYASRNLVPLEDFGNGVMLFSNKDK